MLLGEPDHLSAGSIILSPKKGNGGKAFTFRMSGGLLQRLTANLGVRWDYYGPDTTPVTGGLANYNPNTGQQVLANLGGNSSSAGVQPYYKDWAPRVGLAYKLTDQP